MYRPSVFSLEFVRVICLVVRIRSYRKLKNLSPDFYSDLSWD